MALQQSFAFSESQDGTILYLDDTTGEYDAISNPGGYGSPNTARTDLAIVVVTNYKPVVGDTLLTAETYDPEVAIQWEYQTLPADGWYQAMIFTVPKKTGAESPVLNDFVYDFTANQLQRWNGSSWAVATSADLVTYDFDHVLENHPHLKDLFSAFNWLNKLLLGACCDPDNDLVQYMMETDVVINGGLALFTEGNYNQFEKNIEKYQSRVNTILALS